MDKEWEKLANISNTGVGAWDLSGVQEWRNVRGENPDPTRIHIGSLHELCVEKGSELKDYLEDGVTPNPAKKYKGRVVFFGDRVKDGWGNAAVLEELSSSPASMEAGKLCDLWGSQPGNAIQPADGNQAYCQSTLRGVRQTWIRLPHSNDPHNGKGCTTPPWSP